LILEFDEPTRLIVVRHGRTAWNAAGRIQGQLDIALDDHGRWQAARLAAALAHEPIAAIYSSDLQRAHATAAAVARVLGLPVFGDTGLRERGFGHYEGATFAEVAQRWPEGALRWRQRDAEFAPPGGEALCDFYERSVATATRLAAAHAGQLILLVAHGGVLDGLHRAALSLSLQAPRSWQLGNASINRLLHSAAGLSMVGWNDDAHLQVGVDVAG
jgi:2,3-bisphosphoglycerate-dependent phosphoglycerate mutase